LDAKLAAASLFALARGLASRSASQNCLVEAHPS
jgi:hypothetical protein